MNARTRLITLLLWSSLCWVGWCQTESTLQELSRTLQQAQQQGAGLDEARQVLIPRFELLQVQSQQLLSGTGDWEVFFRFFEVTRQQTQGRPLPANLQPSWNRIEALMAQLAQQRGQQLAGPSATGPGDTKQLLAAALQGVLQIEGRLQAKPTSHFNAARRQLGELRNALQRSQNDSASYRSVIQERQRFYLMRSGLELDPKDFWNLDQVLEKLPLNP